ncbi:MAG: hypothetical protein AAFN74_14840 [Myxococcota bacterium]
MTATIQAPKLTQIGARAVLDAALARADALGVPQVVAGGGTPVQDVECADAGRAALEQSEA